jgi:hypothetical protein
LSNRDGELSGNAGGQAVSVVLPTLKWKRRATLEGSIGGQSADERTDAFDIDSLSMRGAQREVTGFLIEQGYTPAGRWEIERLLEGDREGAAAETSRLPATLPSRAQPPPPRL